MTSFQRPPDGRNVARERCVTLLRNMMARFPAMRVGQIIANATPNRFNSDPFHVTDEELAAGLQKLWEDLTC